MKVQLFFIAALAAVALGYPAGKSDGIYNAPKRTQRATKSYGAYTGPAPATAQRISYTQAAPAPTPVKVVPVIQQRVAAVVRPVVTPVGTSLVTKGGSSRYHVQDELGQYNYGFTSADGQAKTEIRGIDGSVAGRYSYIDPKGKHVVLSYVADKGGFRVAGNDLPKAPELPPQLAQEYAVAKVRVAAAKARGGSTDGQYVHVTQGDVTEDHDDDDDDDDGQDDHDDGDHDNDGQDDEQHDDGQYRPHEHGEGDDDNEHHDDAGDDGDNDDDGDDDDDNKQDDDEDDEEGGEKKTYIVGTLVPTYSAVAVAAPSAPAPAPKPAAQIVRVVGVQAAVPRPTTQVVQLVQQAPVQKPAPQLVRVVQQAQPVATAVVRTAGVPVQTGTVAVQTRPVIGTVPATNVQTYKTTLPVKSVGGVQQLAVPTSGVTVPARAPLPSVSQIYAVVQPTGTIGGQTAVSTTGTVGVQAAVPATSVKSHGTTVTQGGTVQVPVTGAQYVVQPQVQVAAAAPTKSHTYTAVVAPQQAPTPVKSARLVVATAPQQQTVSTQAVAVPRPHVKSAYTYTG